MHRGPFSNAARPLTPAMREEIATLARRFGAPIVRELPLDDIAFDPVGNASRFAEVCMVVRRPSGRVLLSIKTFYPRAAYRLPTGGIDRDEPILDALLRETHEETGLEVDARRFLAALTYRDGPRGAPVFHTFAFLLDERGGTLGSLDDHEQIESYREVAVAELPKVAARLERIPPDGGLPRGASDVPRIANWDAWGRFRSHVHRVVHQALTSEEQLRSERGAG